MKKTISLIVVVMVMFCAAGCFSAAKRGQWHAKRGEKLLTAQKYKGAVKNLEAAERAGVMDAKLKYELGSAYLYMGQYKEAESRLEDATKDMPENCQAWFRLGNARLNLNDPAGAAKAYRRAIDVKPDFLDAIEALAMIYPDGGVTRVEALALWKKALKFETRDEWITRANYYIERLEGEETE